MGAYVSIPDCQSHYNITINCSYAPDVNETNLVAIIGGYGRSEIPTNSDIAGIGVSWVPPYDLI